MGSMTYKGIVSWTETFEGEVSENVRSTYDTDPVRLFHGLLAYVATGELVDLEIKRVRTD